MTTQQNSRGGGKPPRWINPGIWFQFFHEPKFLACLVELLKNCFDWNSGQVRVVTNEARNLLRIVDNGCGMNGSNRHAFLAVGLSTASGNQSGTFGTGLKKMMFTFSSYVQAATAPEDEPDLVYVANFSPKDLSATWTGDAPEITWTAVPKDSASWPHEHSFGTDILYTLAEPNSRSLYRGPVLAAKLSERLSNMMVAGQLVLVDNQSLPPKEIKGRLFSMEYPEGTIPGLGAVKLELYRPASNVRSQDLLMTDRSIGEVSFRDTFVKQLLDDDLKELVPEL